MDKLPDSLLLQILSRLDNSADVARCRFASKAFNSVFPGLRSINLDHRNIHSRSRDPNSFRKILFDFILTLETIESVSIKADDSIFRDEDFIKAWLPRVSGSLKSLSMYACVPSIFLNRQHKSNVLLLISAYCKLMTEGVYCHNLVNLKLTFGYLSMQNLHPMPILKSLTLECIKIDEDDEHLNDQLNKCFPNLQVLNLDYVSGLNDLKLHLLNLQTFHWVVFYGSPYSLTLITPNLITLKVECHKLPEIHAKAPMLCHLDLIISAHEATDTITVTVNKFENLKTLSLNSSNIGPLLLKFPITKTLETLTLCSRGEPIGHTPDSKLALTKVFTAFPNVSSLHIGPSSWSELEACNLDLEDWEILDGRKGIKIICAYQMLVDPSLTFSYIAHVLDQCVSLSEVSLLIQSNVSYTPTSQSFMSQCMTRWPGLKWTWGRW
ncbi:F-box/LRR-repeat protein At4g29420-like [Bidens hawaiensis]|uniref:F-box/LRR-repeat protein At4g29420-like n=1 Tax=Bidens hawaiensis TaxID=980011 RepID=UPI00404923F9